MAAITPQQRRFVDEYLIDMNGTQAAIRAGYAKRSAAEQARQLLKLSHVASVVADAIERRSKRTSINADWLLHRLADEAEADLSDLCNEAGELKPVNEWPPIWRKGLVSGIEIEELFEGRGESRVQVGRLHKVKLSDRIRRLELIGKHVDVQAFRERVEHSGIGGGPIETITVGMTAKEAAERYRDELG